MTTLKMTVVTTIIALSTTLFTQSTLAAVSPSKPYIEFSAGGTTQLAQSSHGKLTTLVTGDDPFYSNLYGHTQQENAFGPALNLAAGFYLNDVIRTAISLSYFQADQMARTMATSVDDSTGNGTTTSYYNARTWLFLANIYANFGKYLPLISPTTQPYIGVGLGVANNFMGNQTTYYDGIGINGVSYSNSSRQFAYKLMAGINFALTTNFLFNVQYAFVNAGHYQSGRTGAASGVTFVQAKPYQFQIYANQLTAGLVYQFN